MKKLMLGVSALCLIAFTSCKDDAASKINSENVADAAQRDANAGNFPTISFNETEHDFGTIKDGTPVETVFKYTNTGKTPLVISDIKSTCGCTVPSDWSREPLAPGATGQFTAKFNGKGNGLTTKTITLTTNTEKGTEAVKIKAFIEADPNTPVKAAPATGMPQSIMQQNTTTPVKSSTQPGHEGHNHD